jgi:hypothetical protein
VLSQCGGASHVLTPAVQIISYLDPLSLFYLSRTSKGFRRLLLTRSVARPIWRASFDMHQPDMPECPEDLTEPAYARLAFTTECSNCGKRGIRKVDYGFRKRLCPSCLKSWYDLS